MPQNVTFAGNVYSIPLAGELNWSTLSNFLIAVANIAGLNTIVKQATRIATSTPVTVVAASDYLVVTNLSVAGAVAVDLPAGVSGQEFIIVDGKGDAKTNNITITPNGAQTIEGASTLVISKNRGGVVLQFDGVSNWIVIGYIVPPGTITTADLDSSFVLATTNGGTGQNSTATFPNSGTILNDTNTVTISNKSISGSTNPITNVSLTTGVTGILPIANGGTNSSSAVGGYNNLSPMTTTGDLEYEVSTGVAARLPIGSSGDVLTVSGGVPAWAPPAFDGTVTSIDVSGGTTGLSTSGGPITSNGTITIAGTLGVANGGTGQTTSIAAFDALSPLTTKGDIVAYNGTHNVRHVVGADGTVLTADSTQADGLNWTSTLSNPMTTPGDTIYGGTVGAPNRLAGNTTTQKQFYSETGTGSAANPPTWGPLIPGDLPAGITDGSSATAGYVGERFSSTATTAVFTTPTTITSITLTAGEWEVFGTADTAVNTVSLLGMNLGLSSTNNAFDSNQRGFDFNGQGAVLNQEMSVNAPNKRYSVTTNTTIYLIGQASAASGNYNFGGYIWAMRVR